MLANTSPTIEIVKEGEEWNLTFKVCIISKEVATVCQPRLSVKVSLKTNKICFKIGEEFTESSPVDQTPQQVNLKCIVLSDLVYLLQ